MKNLVLEFFRCYDSLSITFKPGINLLIGDNASGKTSVLSACKYVLGSFFSGFSTEYTKFLSPTTDDFMQLESYGITPDEQPLKIHFDIDKDCLPDVFGSEITDKFNLNRRQTIQKNSFKNSRALITGLKDYRNFGRSLKKSYVVYDIAKKAEIQRKPLPLFASFTTEDIHKSRKINSAPFIKYAQKRSFGYYECLEGNGLFRFWQKRLKVLQEGGRNLDEIEIVRKAIIDALGNKGCDIIYDIQVRPEYGSIFYKFSDGREIESNLLSDGYKRLVNIVTDLAERCSLLNKSFYGLNAAIETKGTVLIDEIDMHLHPTLQSKVLIGLRNAFPHLQFIVTTHAPMVMAGVQNIDDNVVYKLEYSSKEHKHIFDTVNPYGMDISSIVKVILQQSPRPEEVEHKINELFRLIDNGDFGNAKTLLSDMYKAYGDNISELSEAQTLINLNIVEDEANQQK